VTRRPPPAGTPGATPEGEGSGFARADAVAGLAREVDGLRRSMDPLAGLPERVDDLTRLVAQLADAVAAAPPRPAPTPAPSWLIAPADPEATAAVLEGLCGWLHAVYLRYRDAAYQGPAASVALVGDWHDRQRPGVVRRVGLYAKSC